MNILKSYKGEVLSEGVAVGKVYIPKNFTVKKNSTIKKEKEKLEKAIQYSLKQIEHIQFENQADEEYLNIQRLLIEDYTLKLKANEWIEKGFSASGAISKVLNDPIKELASCQNGYLKERALDILDIKNRLIENINQKENTIPQDSFILYDKVLHPSFLIQNKNKVLGVITNKGGYSSHGAILCRQFNIPYMIANINVLEDEKIVLDTRKQQIIVNPLQEEVDHYIKVVHDLSLEEFQAIEHPNCQFLANVSDNLELDKVLKYQFDGVGLYRTEMIFMNEDRPYSYEAQYQIYHEAVLKLKGRPICFRTFDIGDDKTLPYVNSFKKGIDNYINNPELFETQVKAMIMANDYNNMRIMFPMITSYREFIFLKNWVLKIKKENKPDSQIKIGMMLETKEALFHLTDFKDVDFISMGTNDLVLSIYHINRDMQHQKLQKYLDDLIDKTKEIVAFCNRYHICLSICGELAAIGPALKEFMKIGIKNFSVAVPAIRTLNKIYKEIH